MDDLELKGHNEVQHIGNRYMVNHMHDNPNSLTENNDHEMFFKSNMYYALNNEHFVKNLIKLNVDQSILNRSIFINLVTMYCYYLCTKVKRPEFLREQYDGIKYYYHNVFKKYTTININDPQYIKEFYKVFEITTPTIVNALTTAYTPIDFSGFIQELEKASID